MKECEGWNSIVNGTDADNRSDIAESGGNREYKSDVFSMLLEDPVRALEVYNAINGTSYEDPSLVERIEVGERGISLSVRNDASFVLDASLSLYEHQSTICPNMPMRSLVYFSQIIRRMLRNRNVYGRTQIKIPVPHFVVFYNGTEPAEESYELRLSDAFEKHTDVPQIELICRVYNINKGNNKKLMEQCRTLREYMYFVDMVRQEYEQNGREDLSGSITRAIDRCISEDVLADFLKQHWSEVTKVMQLDYTFERQIELERNEAIEIGMERGLAQGRSLGREDGMREKVLMLIRKKLQKGRTLEQIADELEETPESIEPLYRQVRCELNLE